MKTYNIIQDPDTRFYHLADCEIQTTHPDLSSKPEYSCSHDSHSCCSENIIVLSANIKWECVCQNDLESFTRHLLSMNEHICKECFEGALSS